MSQATASAAGSSAQSLPESYNVTATFLDGALAQGWGDRPAIRTQSETLTYAQLAAQANRAGNGLAALGVEMENRVALLLYDSPEFAAMFFGAIRLGAVAVPFNTQLRPQDYLYLLNDSRARVLVAEADLWREIASQRRQMPFLRHVVLVHRDGAPERDQNTVDYSALLSGASTTLATAPTTRDDAALWLYSSGSTGFPKGCVHLQHDMEYCVEHYAKPILHMTPDDITFSAAKLFFAYGLGNGLYFPLAAGASAILYP